MACHLVSIVGVDELIVVDTVGCVALYAEKSVRAYQEMREEATTVRLWAPCSTGLRCRRPDVGALGSTEEIWKDRECNLRRWPFAWARNSLLVRTTCCVSEAGIELE